jgi:uncharacterized ferredoxin-like protein
VICYYAKGGPGAYECRVTGCKATAKKRLNCKESDINKCAELFGKDKSQLYLQGPTGGNQKSDGRKTRPAYRPND